MCRQAAPAMEREMRSELTERAERHAINVFAANLRPLLLQPPLRGRVVMGIDPGYRTGCKIAVVDQTGKYVAGATIYPHAPQNRWAEAGETIRALVDAHGVWFHEMQHVDIRGKVKAGHAIVMDAGGGPEVGFWGSNNSLGMVAAGAVGIITDGYVRDTAELTLQCTPVCARKRGRTIIPGRIEVVEVETPIACGGVQVRPGDIIGCDDDGVVVVPIEVAEEVAKHAQAVLLADMRGRRRLYEQLAMEPDETVDVETVKAYYQQLA